MDLEDVPNYVADRFDPSASFDADGEFALADSIDYRPVAGRLLTNAPSADIDPRTKHFWNYNLSYVIWFN